ncbi:alpha-amylase-related protein-like [Haemaphysalis longicornis]
MIAVTWPIVAIASTRRIIAWILFATICLPCRDVYVIAGRFDHPGFFGDRTTIVQLFEWAWPDVAQECVDFLGPSGYGAVQVSPPNENAFLLYKTPGGVSVRSWYERYEPVSYQMASPSGNLQEFIEMVRRCNESQVRVFVDVVLNHMTSSIGEGKGYNGSSFNSDSFVYDGVPYRASDFHSHADCGTASGLVEDYSNVVQVRNCKFRGRADLNHKVENVRSRIVNYLMRLLSVGVSGFRVDGADYMWPEDLELIYKRLSEREQTEDGTVSQTVSMGSETITARGSIAHTQPATDTHPATDTQAATDPHTATDTHPATETQAATHHHTATDPQVSTDPHTATDTQAATDPHTAAEAQTSADALPATAARFALEQVVAAANVDHTASPPQTAAGSDAPFIYHEMSTLNLTWTREYQAIGAVTNSTFFKIYANAVNKAQQSALKALRPIIMDERTSPSHVEVVYVDSHETQRGLDVEHAEHDVVSYRDRKRHVLATVLMLAQPRGVARVMSSYDLEQKFDTYVPPKKLGPPFDHLFNTKPVLMKENYVCYNGWICEHRWLPIRHMVRFRNAVGDAPAVNWWDDDEDAVSFARLRRGFVLVNNGRSTVNGLFNTTLPAGYYCDVLTGSRLDGRSCTGRVVRVRGDGFAHLTVDDAAEVPAVAIQIEERVFPDYY